MANDGSKKKGEAPAGRSGLGLASVVFLAALLVAPGIALLRANAFGQPLWTLAIISAVSSVAFVVLWLDKRRAETDGWRVQEKVLHLLELLGGWPGSFLAQRLFRHKTVKLSYQVVFWLIVVFYEWLAIDFLLGWRMAGQLRRLVGL